MAKRPTFPSVAPIRSATSGCHFGHHRGGIAKELPDITVDMANRSHRSALAEPKAICGARVCVVAGGFRR